MKDGLRRRQERRRPSTATLVPFGRTDSQSGARKTLNVRTGEEKDKNQLRPEQRGCLRQQRPRRRLGLGSRPRTSSSPRSRTRVLMCRAVRSPRRRVKEHPRHQDVRAFGTTSRPSREPKGLPTRAACLHAAAGSTSDGSSELGHPNTTPSCPARPAGSEALQWLASKLWTRASGATRAAGGMERRPGNPGCRRNTPGLRTGRADLSRLPVALGRTVALKQTRDRPSRTTVYITSFRPETQVHLFLCRRKSDACTSSVEMEGEQRPKAALGALCLMASGIERRARGDGQPHGATGPTKTGAAARRRLLPSRLDPSSQDQLEVEADVV